AGLEEFSSGNLTLTDGREPLRVQTIRMSSNLPTLLGTPPLLGRPFTREETAAGANVLLLSHALWRSRYGGRADVIGQALVADGKSWTIIGVMPADAARPNGDPRT